LKACEVLAEWRSMKGTWKRFSAPKMEVGYFDVLIRSRLATEPDEVRVWYEHRAELQDYIARNEQEDFALQQSLATAQRRSRWMTSTAVGFGALALVLLVLTGLLWFAARRLRREKRQLEEAKRRDVERIANVETTLSVLRHDVSPFMGYLANPDLTPELRDEVLGQLLRTFDNIKNWTSLSIPSGLAFSRTNFPLQEVFDDVQRQVLSPSAGVGLHFVPTPLHVTGDRLLVTILLRNLINNALQHTGAGSVTVSAQADGEMVDIMVSDTGSGMTAEQVEALFRADRTLPAGSEHGFGLILCRYIIKKHDDLTRRGCRIWAESEPGRGTTMHVRLSS
jgi:signal transduction histidine kinase